MTEWDSLYMEINYLALLVNRHTDFAVWIHMQGHVNNVSVRIAESKENYNHVIVSDEFYFKGYSDTWPKDGPIEKLVKIRDQLKHMLETKKINYEAFIKVPVESWEYSF